MSFPINAGLLNRSRKQWDGLRGVHPPLLTHCRAAHAAHGPGRLPPRQACPINGGGPVFPPFKTGAISRAH